MGGKRINDDVDYGERSFFEVNLKNLMDPMEFLVSEKRKGNKFSFCKYESIETQLNYQYII